MANEARDRFDDLLDGALAHYADAEPRPGLEERVLDRIRVEGTAPRSRFLPWAVPAAVAASLLAGAIVWSHRPVRRNPEIALKIERTQSAPAPVESAKQTRIRRGTQPAMTGHPQLPKRPVFPTPQPLSPEERSWLAFVRRDPERAAEAVREPPPMEIEPIRIEAIEIPPIDIGEIAK